MRKLAVLSAITFFGTTSLVQANDNQYQQTKRAVCYYFPERCSEAMNVVGCETGYTYSPWAANGQYLGIFQMGSTERATYGHGNNVWAQAKAARKYFDHEVQIGLYGWHPWTCRP